MNRNESLRKFMECLPQETDAVILRDQANRKYLTGFLSTAGTLFVTHDAAYFIIDGRYYEAAKNAVPFCDVILEDDLNEQLRCLAARHNVHAVELETNRIPLAQALELQKALEPVKVVFSTNAQECLKKCREIKTQQEINAIRAAQHVAVSAFEHMLMFARAGVPELELAAELGTFAARHGCQRRAFSMIFTSGEKTALPHGAPPDRTLSYGDIVMVDMSCMIDGFFSDMTRTFCVGKADEEKEKIYKIVYEAQQNAIRAIRPGVICRDVDTASREVISKAGYGSYYPHGLGHGIGAETHEFPRFSQNCDTVLEPGHVLSVEPGIYLPRRFGVRIEDLMFVTPDGCEMISQASEELIVVG